jgi:hypothetical protein
LSGKPLKKTEAFALIPLALVPSSVLSVSLLEMVVE